jgi:hypothetical protein
MFGNFMYDNMHRLGRDTYFTERFGYSFYHDLFLVDGAPVPHFNNNYRHGRLLSGILQII